MGVKSLLRWGLPPGISPSPADEQQLTQLCDALGCKASKEARGMWEVKAHLLKQQSSVQPAQGQAPGGMRELWLVQHNDASDTCYLVDRQTHSVLEADNGMLSLIEKKLEYKIKVTISITGRRLNKGDFGLRVGSVSQTVTGPQGGVVALGHVLEVEYGPLSTLQLAAPLMGEFVGLLAAHVPPGAQGQLEPFRPPFDKYTGLPPSFGFSHSAVQYVELVIAMLSRAHQQKQYKPMLQQQQQQQQAQPVQQTR